MPRIYRLNQAGDTIVEVLLAIAIVSAVLGASFASINQSALGNRQSQERSEALKLAEAQLELLSGFEKKSEIITDTSCISDLLTLTPAAECKRNSDGLYDPDGRYQVSIKKHTTDNTYSSIVEWDKVGGGSEKERVEIFYRVEN